jgi:hypothetical protein
LKRADSRRRKEAGSRNKMRSTALTKMLHGPHHELRTDPRNAEEMSLIAGTSWNPPDIPRHMESEEGYEKE